ncbi:MAG: putative lipid II flippase FtsW [Desulfobacteraceae bacterium]|nr:putative lipid II flippase FtsW [Desulfobacteraceae bacterium]
MITKNRKKNSGGYDFSLLLPVLLLVGIGIVMVYSASSEVAFKKYGNDYLFLKKQGIATLIGIFAMIVFSYTPYRLLRHFSYLFLITGLGLLIILKVSGMGYEAGGATRWLRFKGFSFQPSEFARFALVIYMAYSLSKKHENIKNLYIGFLPHVIVLGIFSALIFMQPDFGSVVILAIITWIMMFVGGVRIMHLTTSLLLILPVAVYYMMTAQYRIQRLISFLDPWKYPRDEGYQIIHSLMAFGTGGLWGSGIGQGDQKLFYLPEPHTDFIFSVIGEELGFVGVVIIISLYALVLWRGIIIAKNTDDLFGSYLALGLTVAIGLQVFFNMGVALALFPTKGLTLPFLSYGGTSLLLNMAFVGILMNIGRSG